MEAIWNGDDRSLKRKLNIALSQHGSFLIKHAITMDDFGVGNLSGDSIHFSAIIAMKNPPNIPGNLW